MKSVRFTAVFTALSNTTIWSRQFRGSKTIRYGVFAADIATILTLAGCEPLKLKITIPDLSPTAAVPLSQISNPIFETPAPTPTLKPTATPSPTPKPTPTPTSTSTPKPTPTPTPKPTPTPSATPKPSSAPVPQVLSSIVLTPAAASVSPGGTIQLSASAKDQFGNVMNPQPVISWSATGGGTISMTGLYTAGLTSGGPFEISADSGSHSGTASITVTPLSAGCSNAPRGKWLNMTPPSLNMAMWCAPYSRPDCPWQGLDPKTGLIGTFGIHYAAADPNNAGVVYLGTSSMGIWKSTDCGANFVHINTGQHGAELDSGRQWTIAIDPVNSQIVYTTSGYTSYHDDVQGYTPNGLYRSTNGGVDWLQKLPQSIVSVSNRGWVEKITIDPTPGQNKHLVLSFHDNCEGTPPPGVPSQRTSSGSPGYGCMAESFDGGDSWSLTSGPGWSGLDGPGQTIVPSADPSIPSKTWLYFTNSDDGIYLTTTGGVSPDGKTNPWTKVPSGAVSGSGYVASNGTLFASAGGGLITSPAGGGGKSWSYVPNAPGGGTYNGSSPIVQAGQTLFVSTSNPGYYAAPFDPLTGMLGKFLSLPIDSSTGPMKDGGYSLTADPQSRVIYSSNMLGGAWRYFIP